jgi:hypothetical protein
MRILLVVLMLTSVALAEPQRIVTSPDDYGDARTKDIAQVMMSNSRSFKDCYLAAQKKQPRLAGKFVYQFTIRAGGAVDTVKAVTPTRSSRLLDGCMIAAIKRVKFPASVQGKVTFPFVFARQ